MKHYIKGYLCASVRDIKIMIFIFWK